MIGIKYKANFFLALLVAMALFCSTAKGDGSYVTFGGGTVHKAVVKVDKDDDSYVFEGSRAEIAYEVQGKSPKIQSRVGFYLLGLQLQNTFEEDDQANAENLNLYGLGVRLTGEIPSIPFLEGSFGASLYYATIDKTGELEKKQSYKANIGVNIAIAFHPRIGPLGIFIKEEVDYIGLSEGEEVGAEDASLKPANIFSYATLVGISMMY